MDVKAAAKPVYTQEMAASHNGDLPPVGSIVVDLPKQI